MISQNFKVNDGTESTSNIDGISAVSRIQTEKFRDARDTRDTQTTKSNLDSSHHQPSHQNSNLPMIPPNKESYLLNGIVNHIELKQSEHLRLVSQYQQGHFFTATRLPTRKLNFRIQDQIGFNHYVPSEILITPFTVVVVVKVQDLIELTGTKFGIVNQKESKEMSIDGIQMEQIELSKDKSIGTQPQD